MGFTATLNFRKLKVVFDVFCDLLLDGCTATWNLYVFYNNETNYYNDKTFFFLIFQRKPAFAHFGEREKSDLA